ncbi:MAG: amino acid adenylation domain-containing protein [Gammaproteobacteria bacterium]|nr:amino acid adenylation domain-containing protein [Gammaproteobacteria bacterium]
MDISKQNVKNLYPLSPMQEGLLFHALADADSPAYFQQIAFTVDGDFDTAVFQAAWNELVRRHDILRTVFVHANVDRPLQVVLKECPVEYRVADIRSLPAAEQPGYCQQAMADERRRGFDLSRDGLLRIQVLRLGEDRYRVIWSYHHILLDGWSLGLAQRELLALYQALRRAQPPALPAPAPYSRYIKWLQGRDAGRSRAFWNDFLKDYRQAATVPVTANGPARIEDFFFDLDEHAVRGLKSLAVARQVTLNTVLQSIWALLLARYNAVDDVVFGSIVAGRPSEVPGIEQMVGLFINLVAVRIRPRGGLRFSELLQDVQRDSLDSEPHQHYPFSQVQADSALPQGLIGTALLLENYPAERQVTASSDGQSALGFDVSDIQIFDQGHFDFVIKFMPAAHAGMQMQLACNTGRFDPRQIARVAAHFKTVVQAVLADPEGRLDDIDLLSVEERDELLHRFNDAPPLAVSGTVVERFQAQANRTPDAPALVGEREALSYQVLESRTNQLAHYLMERGVGPETRVAICLDRSPPMVIALLAVLKAGGAYLPLDPDYPRERLAFMLGDAQVAFLLTEERLASPFADTTAELICYDRETAAIDRYSTSPPPLRSRPEHLAYVLYTSGSTGQPKGALNTHGALCNHMAWMQAAFPMGPDDALLQKTAFSFDASVWEFFAPLLSGGRLALPKPGGQRDARYLVDLIAEQGITVIQVVPTLLQALLDEGLERCTALRRVFCGGEPLTIELRDRFLASLNAELINLYGVSEANIDTLFEVCRPDEAFVPVGRPTPNCRAHILDARGRPAPVGVVGELYLGGAGVGRGYAERPGLTAERFVPDPFSRQPGSRLYRTGDSARYLADGRVEFLGRRDHQVKLHGYRIELGEVETALKAHPAVTQCVALVREDRPGEQRLVAYLVASSPLDPAELRARLLRTLPDFMAPAAFVPLPRLPLTPNGKIDRRALPAPDLSPAADAYRAPRDPVEEQLAAAWAQVLNVERVGIDDNYLVLGGDSIKAIQVASRLLRQGFKVGVRDLFRYPTIAELAPHVKSAQKPSTPAATAGGHIPLTPAQSRFLREHTVQPQRFNHAVSLSAAGGIDERAARQALSALLAQHDALRLRFTRQGETWVQTVAEPAPALDFRCVDLRGQVDWRVALESQADALQGGFDLAAGGLLKAALFHTDDGERLLIVIHHLAVDGVSWRILLEDFDRAYEQSLRGETCVLPARTDSFAAWAQALERYSRSPALLAETAYWRTMESESFAELPGDRPASGNRQSDAERIGLSWSAEDTGRLQGGVNATYGTSTEEILLTALGRALHRWRAVDRVLLVLEGHGREALPEPVDLGRTVGWFTSLYPYPLALPLDRDIGYQIRSVKESLRKMPGRGMGFGVLRYLTPAEQTRDLRFSLVPRIAFNYLGDFAAGAPAGRFRIVNEPVGDAVSPDAERLCALEISGLILHGALEMSFSFNRRQFDEASLRALTSAFASELKSIVEHCIGRDSPELTPADLSYSDLSLDEFDQLFT